MPASLDPEQGGRFVEPEVFQPAAERISEAYWATVDPAYHGRTSKLGQPRRVAGFLAALATGNYLTTAARAAGIGEKTIHDWMKHGREDDEAGIDSPYSLFHVTVNGVMALAEQSIVDNVRRAALLPQFWAAGMTILERRHPERWARRDADSSGGPKVVVQIGVSAGDVQVKLASPAGGESADPAKALDSPIDVTPTE